MMYQLVSNSVPFLEKYSFYISVFLFIFWVIQTKSKKYIKYIEGKAQDKYIQKQLEIAKYNLSHPSHSIQLTSSWLDLYKVYMQKRHTTLLLSFVFAYISFNTTSYFDNNNENFFKLLTISTTLFLAGITYIQQRYRE